MRCPQASVMLARVLLQFSFRKHVVLEWKLPLTRMIVLLPHIAVMAGRIREACQLLRYFVNLPVSTQLFILFFFTCTCMWKIAAVELTFSANLDCVRHCIWGVCLEHHLHSSWLWVKLISSLLLSNILIWWCNFYDTKGAYHLQNPCRWKSCTETKI